MTTANTMILVADNHYGWHQPEIVAAWLIDNDAQHEKLGVEDLRKIAENNFPEDGDEWSAYVDDLYFGWVHYDGAEWYLWTHPDGMDVWLVPVGYDPEAEDEDN